MPHSVRTLAVSAWCLLSVTLSAVARENDTATNDTAQAQARKEQLSKELDELVMRAAKEAKADLPKKVRSAKQALNYAPAEYRNKDYRVLEHKGWWIVAWQPNGSEPFLTWYGAAIRKNSKDIFRFGAW